MSRGKLFGNFCLESIDQIQITVILRTERRDRKLNKRTHLYPRKLRRGFFEICEHKGRETKIVAMAEYLRYDPEIQRVIWKCTLLDGTGFTFEAPSITSAVEYLERMHPA